MHVTCIDKRMGLVTHSDICRKRERREQYHLPPRITQPVLSADHQAMSPMECSSYRPIDWGKG